MSVTFFVHPHGEHALNVGNRNAVDLLAWLGYDVASLCPEGLCGELDAVDLAARCRRRLWDEPRNRDPALADERLGPRALACGRPAGYLRDRTAALLAVAELAGAGVVRFG